MKKLIALGLVSLSLSAAIAEAKAYIGVEGGIGIANTILLPEQGVIKYGSEAFRGQELQNWIVGINGGTEHFFGEYFGLRWFLGLNYGQLYKPSATGLQTFGIQLGGDVLVNFVATGSLSFGMFVGLAGSVDFVGNNNPFKDNGIQSGLLGRAGLTLGIGEHHRVDFTTNIPILTANIAKEPLVYNPITFTLGYKFLF